MYTGEGSHHCKVCNRKFTNQHRRDVHEKKHVDNVVVKQFECSKCGMAFEEKGEFEIHMETHKTQHTCHCGRSFYTQAALFIHTMGHQNSEGTELVEVSQMSSTLKLVVLYVPTYAIAIFYTEIFDEKKLFCWFFFHE